MDKNTLIQKYFQKKHLLKMTNPSYQKTVNTLFTWLTTTDQAENDQTSLIIARNATTKQSLINTTTSIKTKQNIIVAGIEEIEWFLKKYPQISFRTKIPDGKNAKRGQEIAILSGDSRTILSLERTILNILQRMSGIATQTRKFAQILSPIQIAATRKTPWMQLDKKAVALGGGLTHRLDLSDGILIKDNHLQILKNQHKLSSEAQAVALALEMTLSSTSNNLTIEQFNNSFIEIEVTTKEGADAAIKTFKDVIARPQRSEAACERSETGACFPNHDEAISTNNLIIMLDNWNPQEVKKFLSTIHYALYPKTILFEASGNINEDNLQDWADTGVDIISSGALTHSAKAADLSLSITP